MLHYTCTYTPLMDSLLQRLKSADLVCNDCGSKYGKYTLGRSSINPGTCQVCCSSGFVSEVRDYGYLQEGIAFEEFKIKEAAEGGDDENVTLTLTLEELSYLNHCLDIVSDAGIEEEDTSVFIGLESKVNELYAENCMSYTLSPVLIAYHEKYGNYGMSDSDHFMKFKDNYDMLVELGFVKEDDNA